MRPSTRLFTLLALLVPLLSAPVLAAASATAVATVEIVQSPAWRDRQGVTVPLAPGMALKSGDVLRTAPGARTYLMLADGSRVKLGGASRFTFYTHSLRPQKSFRGALDVLAGAFRFTTGRLAQRSKGVAIRVGTTTIGIRGTDLWGRTDDSGDLVALLEGRLEINRAGQITELAQPMTYFDAPHGQASAIKTLEPGIFEDFARQTEILPGDGAARRHGQWRILAGTAPDEQAALELYDQLREAGFAASIRPRKEETEGWNYDVLLGGFASAAEAEIAAARLTAISGLKSSVVR